MFLPALVFNNRWSGHFVHENNYTLVEGEEPPRSNKKAHVVGESQASSLPLWI